MKKFLSLFLALVLLCSVMIACDSEEPAETAASTAAPTAAPTDAPTEAPTAAPTEAPTEAAVTVPAATEESGDDELPYELEALPIAYSGDLMLEGYHASGDFEMSDDAAVSTTGNSMFIVKNDTMKAGRLTATFTAPEGNINDNGIIFGMEDDDYEQYFFWEDGPAYYFLFVSDDRNLYLAKASYYNNPWEPLIISDTLPNYEHGDEITISVEFDGEGQIDCYVNDEWIMEFYDYEPLWGSNYGIRCEVPEVTYTSVVAEKTEE